MKSFILITLLSVTQFLNAQNEGSNNAIWASIEDLSILPVADENGKLISSSPQFQELISQHNISSVIQILPSSKKENLLKVFEITCDCNQDDLIQEILRNNHDLSSPFPAPVYELMSTPNDYNEVFASDYALDLINAQGAWDVTNGDSTVEIAISDSNYDLNHEELIGKTTYIQSPLTNPNYYHGTAVAITASGNTNNGMGKSSIGYNCKLQLYSMGYNSLLNATYNGARVLNVSWYSSCNFNAYIQNVIDEIYENGTIIIAAAGNGGTCGGPANYVYPASCNHVISVTSIGPDNNHERYIGDPNSTHQHNDSVDISAPGYDVALTVSSGWYLTGNGSSFATPYVSGTVGLMLSVNPCLTFEDIDYILKETALNIDSLNSQYTGLIGAGRLDAEKAVQMAADYNTLIIPSEIGYGCTSNSGYINLIMVDANGTAPYQYNWDFSAGAGSSLIDIPTGVYEVIVIDANGCKGSLKFKMKIPEELTLDFSTINNLCYLDNSGSVYTAVQNGTPDYTYNWSNGSTESYIDNLSSGTYLLSITDANNCQIDKTFTITNPDELELDILISSNIINSTKNIDLTIYGGIPDYEIIWSNSSTDEDQLNVEDGEYTVMVEDDNGCTASSTITVSSISLGLNENDNLTTTLYPNPSAGLCQLEWGNDKVNIVEIYNANGQIIQLIDVENINKMELNISAPGVYYVNLYSSEKMLTTEKLVIF